jgi:hypothetical protein
MTGLRLLSNMMGLPGSRRDVFAFFQSLSSRREPDLRGVSIAGVLDLFLRRLAIKVAPRKPVITTTATAPIAIPALAPALRALELLCWEFEIGGVGVDSEDEVVVGLVVVDFEGGVLRVDVGIDEVELVEEDAVILKYREGREGALAFPFSISHRKNTEEVAKSKA